MIKIFGDRLKQFRVAADLTQVELGQKAGIHPITISKWERGELTEVRSTSLLKLAKVLGVTPNDLLIEGEGKDEH